MCKIYSALKKGKKERWERKKNKFFNDITERVLCGSKW